MTPLIIVGAGGFGLEVAAYAQNCGENIKGFWDDTKDPGTLHAGHPVLGPTTGAIDKDATYIVAIGLPAARRTLTEKLQAKGATFKTLIHPQSYVAPSAQLGQGCLIAPFAFVGPEAKLGEHVLLNIYASIAHECAIGDGCTLAPYAGTHATACLEEGVFLGAHSVITNGQTIGARSKVAAASVVYSSFPADSELFGNPARSRASA